MNIGDDGHVYNVDGIDDKLNITNQSDEGVSIPLFKFKSSCIDDATSDWLASYGDVNRYNFLTIAPHRHRWLRAQCRRLCEELRRSPVVCSGDYTDTSGQRAMGYYDQDFLNYYYYMASQFAVSDRWFSPMAAKSNPNRVATFSGGTTQGLAFDQGYDDHLGSLSFPNIFHALDNAHVSWKVYYSDTSGECGVGDNDCGGGNANYPATALGYITYTKNYLYPKSHACRLHRHHAGLQRGRGSIELLLHRPQSHRADFARITPISPTARFPASPSSSPVTASTTSIPDPSSPSCSASSRWRRSSTPSWPARSGRTASSSSATTKAAAPTITFRPCPATPTTRPTASDKPNYPVDIASISVSPDSYKPCVPATPPATAHCDLRTDSPGAHPGDAAAVNGFGAQIGFRVPNIVISPFTRRHYVSHVPMDHTAIIKFVEDRFIGDHKYLTSRDAAQPSLLDFFDFSGRTLGNAANPARAGVQRHHRPQHLYSVQHVTCTPSGQPCLMEALDRLQPRSRAGIELRLPS